MSNSYKVAGQAAPAASTDTLLYTVPTGKQFVGSTLTICNRDTAGVNAAFRVAVAPSGQALANQHYTHYDQIVQYRDTERLTMGIALAAGDKVYVRADTANVSFSLFGNEIS